MGMPGSEVALTELTAALFGQMRMDGQVEVLMDDIYIGAASPEELLARWTKALDICERADIRLGPKKVTITKDLAPRREAEPRHAHILQA